MSSSSGLRLPTWIGDLVGTPDSAIDGTNALDFLQSIYRNVDVSLSVRMRAAALALPFESPKLAVTAYITDDNFAERLEQALARSEKAPKMIEAKPIDAG